MRRSIKALTIPLLLVFYEAAIYLSNDMYLPALPEMMRDLHLSTASVQLTLTSWFIGAASMPLVMGALADRFGRRSVLLIGGLVYIASSIGCAMATNFHFLIIMRFIQGAMGASMLVPGYACIHELYDRMSSIRILALMGSIAVLAPALGPLIGSLILYIADWRGIFWVISLWSIVAIFFLYRHMPETLPLDKRESLHLINLIHKFIKVINNKHFFLLMSTLGFIFCGFLAWIAAGSLLVIENFHHSALSFGIIQALVFGAYILGNRCVKYLLARLGIDRLIVVGLATTLLGGFLIVFFAYLLPTSLNLFLVSMMIFAIGSGFCFSALNRLVVEASDEPMGIRMAAFEVFLTAYAVLGSTLASFFFDGSILSLGVIITLSIVAACVLYAIERLTT